MPDKPSNRFTYSKVFRITLIMWVPVFLVFCAKPIPKVTVEDLPITVDLKTFHYDSSYYNVFENLQQSRKYITAADSLTSLTFLMNSYMIIEGQIPNKLKSTIIHCVSISDFRTLRSWLRKIAFYDPDPRGDVFYFYEEKLDNIPNDALALTINIYNENVSIWGKMFRTEDSRAFNVLRGVLGKRINDSPKQNLEN